MSSPTSEPKLAITYKPQVSLILKAGAGAGKTTTLIRLFFEQVDHFRQTHKKWPRVVLTTFTRKATQEIRERLMKEALKRSDQELFHWLQSKYYVQISTIHGVLSLFLSRYGDRLGLPNDFKLVDDSVILRAKKSVLKKIFDKDPAAVDLLEEFSFTDVLGMTQDYLSASSLSEVKRLTAAELEQQLQSQIRQWQKAVQELSRQATDESLSEKWTQFVEYLSAARNTPGDLAKATAFLENLYEMSPSKPPHTSGKSKVSDPFNDLAADVKDELKLLITKKLSFAARLQDFERVSLQLENIFVQFKNEWRKHQSSNGLITMEDLELLSAQILRDFPDTGQEFSKNFDYWMIDEYQDTSPLQVFLLNTIRGEQSHFVVGDPQQSIYLFRGARSEVFEQKISDVQQKGGEFHRQLINYRSRKEVLLMINQYFSSTSLQFESMSVGSKQSSTAPALVVYPAPAEAEDGTTEDKWTESAAISRMLELIKQGVRPEEICVLSRNHKNLKNVSKLANEYHIPYFLHSAGNYFRQREVQDALQLLRFIDNPHDNINFIALLRSPWFLKQDHEIIPFCEGSSYWQTAAQKFPTDPVVADLQNALQERNEIGDLAVFKKWLIQSGMVSTAMNLDSSGQREANLWKLVHLCEREQSRGPFQIADFFAKAQRLDADSSGEDREPAAVVEPSRVQLMTIHAAKGLQFPHIILVGFGDLGPSPSVSNWNYSEEKKQWAIALKDLETGDRLVTPLAYDVIEVRKQREAQESERLLYVALTRAQDSVTLIWSKVRKNSWAMSFPWELGEGSHDKADFSYEVRRELSLFQLSKNTQQTQVQIPKLWMEKSQSQSPAAVSVTSILDEKSKQKTSGKKFVLPDFEKSKKGQKAHRIFEALKYNPNPKQWAGLDLEMKKALNYTLNLSNPPFQKLLSQAHVEWGFTVPWEGSKLVGQIDMWAFVDNKLWVIDYKTGNPTSAEKSLQQLQIYAECIYKTKRVSDATPVFLCALYPMDEKVFIREFADRKTLLAGLFLSH